MILKGIEAENFENYKVPALFLAFPKCTFKCEKEAGCKMCQNSQLVHESDLECTADAIITLYMNDPLSKAVVCGGLEPLDSLDELIPFIMEFRYYSPDPIVIYTGYTEEEVEQMEYLDSKLLKLLSHYENIIIKFGRYVPNQEKHFDEILGVELASPNQYAKMIGKELNVRSQK